MISLFQQSLLQHKRWGGWGEVDGVRLVAHRYMVKETEVINKTLTREMHHSIKKIQYRPIPVIKLST